MLAYLSGLVVALWDVPINTAENVQLAGKLRGNSVGSYTTKMLVVSILESPSVEVGILTIVVL